MSWSPELVARVDEVATPTAGDVLRAKQALMRQLASGRAESGSELQWILVDGDGLKRQPEPGAQINVTPRADLDAAVQASDPLVASVRLRIATRIALAELDGEGILVGVEALNNPHDMVPMAQGGMSGGVPVWVPQPPLQAAYQMSRRFLSDLAPILDAEIFNADLDPLDLDDRARLCIREALEAYRRGLYLSCVSLLGAVSEGAWWRMAWRLRRKNKQLAAALDNERTSAALLIRLTAEELSKLKGLSTAAAELHSYATYLRELRNYGIHPRKADPAASHEHAFTDAGCSLLLLETHRYLERLASLPSPAVPRRRGSTP